MVKSKLTNIKCDPDYPKLMESKELNVVALMIAPGRGTIVATQSGKWSVGGYHDSLLNYKFSNYSGTVTLENQN